ncbi:MAG: pyrroline-5-carboxylate reductase [Verrucomicrobiota bacterium]
MKFVVIGAGKMGQAIIQGCLKHQTLDHQSIMGVSPLESDRAAFSKLHDPPLLTSESVSGHLASATHLLLSVKPQQFAEVAPQLKEISDHALILSIMAGVTIQQIAEAVGSERQIIRCMPNTPVLCGQGAVAWAGSANLQVQHQNFPDQIFGSVADVVQVDESQLDAVTALSGSGPAFFYRLIQPMIDQGIEEGLSPEQARQLAAQTAIGAGTLLKESDQDISTLIAQVRSKGGTTEAGLNELETNPIDQIIKATLHAAAERSRILSQS